MDKRSKQDQVARLRQPTEIQKIVINDYYILLNCELHRKNEKEDKITITKEIHSFNIDKKTLKLLKFLFTLVQSSVQMETATKKSRES